MLELKTEPNLQFFTKNRCKFTKGIPVFLHEI
jgi:hypothetical protein